MRTIQKFYQSLKSSKNKPMCLVYKINAVSNYAYNIPFYAADDYGDPYNYYYPKNMGTITIDWGDGTSNIITDNKINRSDITHIYTANGIYIIKITSSKFTFPMQWEISSTPRFKAVTEIDGCLQTCYMPKSHTGNNPTFDGESQKDFSFVFNDWQSLTKIPQDLFRYNPQITDVSACFMYDGLTSIPEYLFRYNTNITNFAGCFCDCYKATLNPNIFCDNETEKETRFAGKSVIFDNCFWLDYYPFNGVQGTAPDLWNYTFGTVSSAGCFKGHSTASLTNYNDIPAGWK